MIRCVAIDDEPLALRQIESYINKTPFLELVASFDNAFEVMEFLRKKEADLLFADINMPDLNGIEMAKSLSNPPKIIFTTAYREYAAEGFQLDAADYLLKPISYSDFLKSAEKVKSRYFAQPAIETTVSSGETFLFIKSEYKIIRINYKDIKYIESMLEYVRIHLENHKPVMALMSMKSIGNHLPEKDFMRVHRSFIVNLNKVSVIERNRIVFDEDTYIPVSEQYKADFQHYLDNNFLQS